MNSNNAKPIFIQFTIDFRVFFFFFLKIFFFSSILFFLCPSNLACNCYFQCIILVFFSSLNELEAAIFHTALIYTCVSSSKYQQQLQKKKYHQIGDFLASVFCFDFICESHFQHTHICISDWSLFVSLFSDKRNSIFR